MRAKDILKNTVREKLARGEVVSSMTVRMSRGIEIARIARTAGFDSIYVDMEHSSLSLDVTGQICMAALNMGLAAFVRVPANTPEWIARVLDAGALGVIAPHVSSAAEAREIVRYARFAPRGDRSVVSNLPHLEYRNFPAAEACEALDDATIVMVQLESMAGIDAADDIMAIDGIDMVMVGANDLAADMGIAGDYDNPRLHDAFERTMQACKKHNKHMGIGGLAGRPDLLAKFVAMGARYVSCGTDVGFLISAGAAKVREVQALTK
ncbi:MAG: aldolase/citrate lyase family protein [Pseudomonadota bacterium]